MEKFKKGDKGFIIYNAEYNPVIIECEIQKISDESHLKYGWKDKRISKKPFYKRVSDDVFQNLPGSLPKPEPGISGGTWPSKVAWISFETEEGKKEYWKEIDSIRKTPADFLTIFL